jgi:hypothetical protein
VKFCFVRMPFGTKSDESDRTIHFDRIFTEVIGPAIKDANLEPIRAGGFVKSTLEQMMLCDYTVADLTTDSASVLYQVGVRDGLRPHTTVPIFASGTRLSSTPLNFADSRIRWTIPALPLHPKTIARPWQTD